MVTKEVGIYVPVSEVFPDVQSDLGTFRNLLEQLSLTDTLFWCARLNLVISCSITTTHMKRQQFGLNALFTTEEINRVNAFAKEKGGAEKITVFFRGQLLELMRWALLYCHDRIDDGNTFESETVRRTFVQALLIAGDIWSEWVYRDKFSLENGLEIARQKSLGAMRKAVEATALMPDLARSLGRGWTLFSDCIPTHLDNFGQKFRSETGLSVEEYYICLAAIMANFMCNDTPGRIRGIFNATELGKDTPYEEVLRKYISIETQTANELRQCLWGQIPIEIVDEENIPSFDYRSLREKPILKAYDGRAIILDLHYPTHN